MKVVLNTLLSTLLISTTAFAQGFTTTGPTGPQATSRAQMSTTVQQAPSSSVVLVPAFAIGTTGFASADNHDVNSRYNPSTASSYEGGLLAEFGRHTLVFQTGLLYRNEGLKFNESTYDTVGTSIFTGNYTTHDVSASLKYLDIPLVAKARARIGNGVRLSARAGVMAAIYMGASIEDSAREMDAFGNTLNQQNYSQSVVASSSSGIRPFNVIAVVGAGPEIRVARNQNVRLEGNYERYLMSIFKDPDQSVVLHSWNAMLSYGIGF